MPNNPDFGNDTDAASIYAFLLGRSPAPEPGQAPTPACMPQSRPATTAADIARREGLDLDLSTVRPSPRRQTTRPSASRAPGKHERSRSRRPQPSVEDLVVRTVQGCAPGLPRAKALDLARQWIRSGCSLLELEGWIAALGLHSAYAAARCLQLGLSLGSLDVVVDGMHVRRRLRGGESVDSVLALAVVHDVDLFSTGTEQ
ncbi:hypothetical protein GCM10010495_76560 [Kitasatospora herbaricolor]|uniref:hypothetical protein n=1 Tax=Kitasatospora herbaricolor TaxID=68217 RepID=UPI00188D8A95|nr:hypothetical protein [Kitasatospora herbaricolor]MDQ0305527.1 hypothetical protein [Kitasatospora herbaricolor]GGV47586.1 hypothetical protein GCM10010495_76560 [Kitasatospora herbaricolor]